MTTTTTATVQAASYSTTDGYVITVVGSAQESTVTWVVLRTRDSGRIRGYSSEDGPYGYVAERDASLEVLAISDEFWAEDVLAALPYEVSSYAPMSLRFADATTVLGDIAVGRPAA